MKRDGQMAETVLAETITIEAPDVSHLVTEDDTPVDNLFSAKQQRLLVEPLYTSWGTDRLFVADANVGIFSTPYRPAIVPDVFLSLDVAIAEDWYAKEHRSYFIWEFGKPPDVVVEIVSNTKGEEGGKKLREYARMRVWYYAIYDPQQLIQKDVFRLYELHLGEYTLQPDTYLEKIGLGLTL
jgi:Uma2 family endonuclease